MFIIDKMRKSIISGQTCGQGRKMGLFNPRSREEQAHCVYCENARFREVLRENKKIGGSFKPPIFGLSDTT